MGGCFSCRHCRSSYEQDTKLPETQEKGAEKPPGADPGDRPGPAAPASLPPAATGEACACSLWSPEEPPAGSAAPVPESVPEAALSLEAMGHTLDTLKELQAQYLRGQLRVRRTCQLFPRALRAVSLQVCHARRRLIRIEVRLKRQEGEGPPSLIGPAEGPRLEGLPALTQEPLLPAASASRGAVVSAGSSLSSFSLPPTQQPLLPALPSLRPEVGHLQEALQTLVELQARHLQDRRRDLRGCQECLKSIKALRAQLRNVRNRLWALEAKLGILVPPRELDADEQGEVEEEPEEEPEEELPPRVLEPSREEQETGGCQTCWAEKA